MADSSVHLLLEIRVLAVNLDVNIRFDSGKTPQLCPGPARDRCNVSHKRRHLLVDGPSHLIQVLVYIRDARRLTWVFQISVILKCCHLRLYVWGPIRYISQYLFIFLQRRHVKAVEGLAQKSSTANFQIDFSHSDTFPALDKSLEIAIYRIVQEFINNTIKHGQASNIFINIRRQEESALLSLKDTGIGFNINNLLVYEGQGLKNLESRVESFNGQVNINSTPNEGTEFGISIPLDLNKTQLTQN